MDVVTARTFLAAASLGSFAAAAQEVHASAPAVTERIKQLEHVLGVRLFDRDKRGCRLTLAGRRMVEPAQTLVRAWEEGCARVALPARFERVLRIGGQHALWPSLLIPWLQRLNVETPEVAVRAIAAAPAQLNRSIEADELDICFLYDPARGSGVRIEELAADRLILVTADRSQSWRANFARLHWGDRAQGEIVARCGELPAPGLDLDLGVLALDWLVETGSSGFVPERLAHRYLAAGALTPIGDMPSIEFSPFVCWRAGLDATVIEPLVEKAKQGMARVTLGAA